MAPDATRFEPRSLDVVAKREDALGRLAQIFRRMAIEVEAREERLRREVKMLRIEIDESRAAKQVMEITETDYFQELQQKVADLGKTLRAQQICFSNATLERKAIYYSPLSEPHSKLIRHLEPFDFFDSTALGSASTSFI